MTSVENDATVFIPVHHPKRVKNQSANTMHEKVTSQTYPSSTSFSQYDVTLNLLPSMMASQETKSVTNDLPVDFGTTLICGVSVQFSLYSDSNPKGFHRLWRKD